MRTVLIGDSRAYYWPIASLAPFGEIVNLAVSGSTYAAALNQANAAPTDFDLAVIQVGVNDMRAGGAGHKSPQEIFDGIAAIVSVLKAKTLVPVPIVTLNVWPCFPGFPAGVGPGNYLASEGAALNAMLACRGGFCPVDIQATDTSDGVHLIPDVYAAKVVPAIQAYLKRATALSVCDYPDLPNPATNAWRLMVLKNERNGPCLVISDGAEWKTVTLGAKARPSGFGAGLFGRGPFGW